MHIRYYIIHKCVFNGCSTMEPRLITLSDNMYSFTIRSSNLKDLSKYKLRNQLRFKFIIIINNIWKFGNQKKKQIIMCTDENFNCMDECLGTLRCKAIFFAYWTLLHQIIGFVYVVVNGMELYYYMFFGQPNLRLEPQTLLDLKRYYCQMSQPF